MFYFVLLLLFGFLLRAGEGACWEAMHVTMFRRPKYLTSCLMCLGHGKAHVSLCVCFEGVSFNERLRVLTFVVTKGVGPIL
jgi:hypothetical protein